MHPFKSSKTKKNTTPSYHLATYINDLQLRNSPNAQERFVLLGQCNNLRNSTVEFNPQGACYGMELYGTGLLLSSSIRYRSSSSSIKCVCMTQSRRRDESMKSQPAIQQNPSRGPWRMQLEEDGLFLPRSERKLG